MNARRMTRGQRRLLWVNLALFGWTIGLIACDSPPAAAPTSTTWYSGDGDLVEVTP